MGTLTNALMRVLLSWVRGFVSLIWSIAGGENTGFLSVFERIWLPLAAILIVFGLAADWLVWLFHYKPYVLLAARFRRRFGRHGKTKDETQRDEEPSREQPEEWQQSPPAVTPEEERQILQEASAVPDAELGSYPGMRYQESDLQETRHYAAADEKKETQRFRLDDSLKEEPEQSAEEREYTRRLAEYEQKKAQYDRDMAEYERKMEAYRQASAAQEAEEAPRRRRRGGGE